MVFSTTWVASVAPGRPPASGRWHDQPRGVQTSGERMRFGSADAIAFDVEPVEPSWERHAPADRGPWAKLALIADGRTLTRAEMRTTQQVVHAVHVPLLPLVDWWVHAIGYVSFEESSRIFSGGDVFLHRALSAWNAAPPPRGFDEDHWVDARYEWYARHFWLAGAEGAWVPDVGFVRSDDRLWISWAVPSFLDARAPCFLSRPAR